MSVATSSAGGTLNNCQQPCQCPPCPSVKSNKNSKQRIAKSSGGCNGSMTATLKWNCGTKPTNSSALFGTRCASERVDATWNCVPTLSFGPPSKTGTGCNCPSCAKAQVAAVAAANKTKPKPKTETTSVDWQEQPVSSCPKMTCPNGPCYKASTPTPPKLPDEPQPDVTWSC